MTDNDGQWQLSQKRFSTFFLPYVDKKTINVGEKVFLTLASKYAEKAKENKF